MLKRVSCYLHKQIFCQSETVNMHGRQGCNSPVVEHMNRCLKNMIGNLQSNVKPAAIQRVAKSLGVVKHVCEVFQREAEVSENIHIHLLKMTFYKSVETIRR